MCLVKVGRSKVALNYRLAGYGCNIIEASARASHMTIGYALEDDSLGKH